MIRSHTGAVERRHLDQHGAARRHRSHVDSDDSRASDLSEGGVVGVRVNAQKRTDARARLNSLE